MSGRAWLLAVTVAVLLCAACAARVAPTPAAVVSRGRVEPIRVAWVNSYTEDDRWAGLLRVGLLEALAREGYAIPERTLEFRAFHLGAQPRMPMQIVGLLADAVVQELKEYAPDMVVVSDDEAAQTVIPRYAGSGAAIVFCGVLTDPERAGLLLPGVTGVLERAAVRQTVAMARAFVGGTGDYLVMTTGSVGSNPASSTLESAGQSAGDGAGTALLRVIESWEGWQMAVMQDATESDFILLADYHALPDSDGNPVREEQMMAWMWEHSPVPVFALSRQFVLSGAVGGLVISSEEQGRAAGGVVVRLARGARPAELQIVDPQRYVLAMNMAAVRHWRLPVPVPFALAADVYRTRPFPGGVSP